MHTQVHSCRKMKQPTCPSREEWLGRMWSIQMEERYSATYRKEGPTQAATRRSLENAPLSEMSPSQKRPRGGCLPFAGSPGNRSTWAGPPCGFRSEAWGRGGSDRRVQCLQGPPTARPHTGSLGRLRVLSTEGGHTFWGAGHGVRAAAPWGLGSTDALR